MGLVLAVAALMALAQPTAAVGEPSYLHPTGNSSARVFSNPDANPSDAATRA